MGKKKRNRQFAATKHQPTGIQTIKDDDNDVVNGCSVGVLSEIISELRSPNEHSRDCACSNVAMMAAQPETLAELLRTDVIRTLAPLVVDRVPSVRHRALTALRNMTIYGGLDVCHDMVLKDVLTPLVALFKMFETNWVPEGNKQTDTKLDIFTQAVIILWNLCEASDIAVRVFNKENLLPHLLPCLQHSVYGYTLAAVVAQCVNTVTERNKEAIEYCRGHQVLPSLQLLAQRTDSSSQAVLFQANIMGALVNVMGDELSANSGLSALVASLGQILDIDLAPLVVMGNSKSNAEEKTDLEELEEPGPGGDKQDQSRILLEGKNHADYEDLVNILDAQHVCLGLVANICTSPDEEWEELENSSGSSDDLSAVDMEDDVADNNNHDMFGAPVELHEAFMANGIVQKVVRLSSPASDQLLGELKTKKWRQRISNQLTELRSRALLCINNMVEGLSAESLGGVDVLNQLWDSLTQQLFQTASTCSEESKGATACAASSSSSSLPSSSTSHKPSSPDQDLLESIVTAIRAVVQKLVALNSPKFQQMSVDDVHKLARLAENGKRGVQIHMLRILATIALALVKTDAQHAVVQEVGRYLLLAAAHGPEVVVVAEALDALFDVFADDATDPVKHALQMTSTLPPILPQLKAKMQGQRRVLGEDFITVKNSRDNLVRFIKYLETRPKS